MTSRPLASITSAPGADVRSPGPTSTITPSRTRTSPSGWSPSAGSMVTTWPPLMSSSLGMAVQPFSGTWERLRIREHDPGQFSAALEQPVLNLGGSGCRVNLAWLLVVEVTAGDGGRGVLAHRQPDLGHRGQGEVVGCTR